MGTRRVGRSRGLKWDGRPSCASGEQLRDTWDADALEVISDSSTSATESPCGSSGMARASGPDADLEMTGVYTVRKGRIVLLEFFWDHAEALEAVGLSE